MPARTADEADVIIMGTAAEIEVPAGRTPPALPHQRKTLKSRFEIVKTIGEGTYGKVKLAIEKTTGEHVAIKHIKKQKISRDADMSSIRREIQIMSSLKHPHIVNVREVIENKDKIIMVMDYCPGGELYEYINDRNKLSERDARRIFRQIVSAVSFCHLHGIVHRDLKLENIVLDSERNVKIADFGLSNYYSMNDLLSTFCGSPLYASPEIVNGQPYHGPEVDCWSLGVVLYTLVYGAMPFDSSDFQVLRRMISTADYYEPAQPSEAAGLIRHLLTVNPKKRAKMSDILNHWWVNLGYKETPTHQPYPIPEVLKPVSLRSSCQSLSSDSDGESEPGKVVQPLKGILKKPKLDCAPSDRKCDSPRNKGPLQPVLNSNVDQLSANDPVPKSSETDLQGADGNKIVFDSEKKPARGILKRKGKFSGGDSGCVLNELGTKSPGSDTKENMDLAYNLSDIEAALDGAGEKPDSSQTQHHVCRAPAADFVLNNNNAQNVDSSNESSSTVAVVPRRGILKKNQSDQRKRWSACSGGSNSSADILDFSYDSGDENYMNITKCFRRDSSVSGTSSISVVDNDDLCFNDDLCTTLTPDEGHSSSTSDELNVFDKDEAREILKQALKFCNKS